MPENPNQPREDDAVLGGQNIAPAGSVILGGLEGVRRRLGVGNPGVVVPAVEQRVAALKDALKYGQKGLNLVIHTKSGLTTPFIKKDNLQICDRQNVIGSNPVEKQE